MDDDVDALEIPLHLACSVCKQEGAVVAASSLGAVSLAYCNDCLRAGRESFDMVVGGMIGVASGARLVREDVHADVLATVDASLAYAGKTWDDLADAVQEADAEYDAYLRGL